mmetsp:Transcript_2269/g.2090  ORF Transcript_2269/g.2090 Transcript_2269/m.2090 type:complete len:277 (-) Transcript_2269:165-995(-)
MSNQRPPKSPPFISTADSALLAEPNTMSAVPELRPSLFMGCSTSLISPQPPKCSLISSSLALQGRPRIKIFDLAPSSDTAGRLFSSLSSASSALRFLEDPEFSASLSSLAGGSLFFVESLESLSSESLSLESLSSLLSLLLLELLSLDSFLATAFFATSFFVGSSSESLSSESSLLLSSDESLFFTSFVSTFLTTFSLFFFSGFSSSEEELLLDDELLLSLLLELSESDSAAFSAAAFSAAAFSAANFSTRSLSSFLGDFFDFFSFFSFLTLLPIF